MTQEESNSHDVSLSLQNNFVTQQDLWAHKPKSRINELGACIAIDAYIHAMFVLRMFGAFVAIFFVIMYR